MSSDYLASLGGQRLTFLLILGMAPSLVWLWYYLKKDNHPEPKKMVVKAFIFGFLSVFLAFGLEFIFMKSIAKLPAICPTCKYDFGHILEAAAGKDFLIISIVIFWVLAYIEEAAKYLAARAAVKRSPALDEPVDAMIYLIAAALGFAAAENIGYVLQDADNAVSIAYFRFFSATFVHALASAVVGYFYARALIRGKNRALYSAAGLVIATALHTLFNLFIVLASEDGRFIYLTIILIAGFSIIVSRLFINARALIFHRPNNLIIQQ